MNLEAFNALAEAQAEEKLLQCCHSSLWTRLVLEERPFTTEENFLSVAERVWFSLNLEDQLEAYEAHPEIGNADTLKEKFRATKALASSEQAKVAEADEGTLNRLVLLNQEYKSKNGFIFIVFATGKTAPEMLAILQARLQNTRKIELANAAREQWKITQLRMEKLL